MNHTIHAALAIALLSGSAALHAAAYKGQKIYIESCKECHGGGQELAASKKQREWEKLTANNAKKLAESHLSSPKAQPSWGYFSSRDFARNSKHLRDFLTEYAEDSGNVPACN